MYVQKPAGVCRVTTVFGAAEPAAAAIAEPPAPSAADKNVIEDMVYAKLPGGRIQITLKMSKTPTEPAAFSITNPPRIALDFPKTQVARAKKTLQIKEGAVSNVTAVEVDDRTRVVLSLDRPGRDATNIEGEIIMDFLNTSVAADLQRRLDVVDFATPVQTIDTFVQGKNTRMVIAPKGKYEHVAYQAGNVFTVSITPIIAQ